MLGNQGQVAATVQQLRERGLLWGRDDQLHLVRPVREAFEPYPGGLAPRRPAHVGRTDRCGTGGVRRGGRGPYSNDSSGRRPAPYATPTGSVTVTSASSPIERLLSHQLLRPLDSETVIIPREVAWRLRGSRFAPDPVATEPPADHPGDIVMPTALTRPRPGRPLRCCTTSNFLAHRVESVPHKLLRGGGLGNRDVTALAQHLGADPAHAVFVIECAAAARLVAPGQGGDVAANRRL